MPSIDYNRYRTTTSFNQRVRFLILHYTAADFATSIKLLTRGQVSAHYLIPALNDPSYLATGLSDMRIFNLVDEQHRAWHAGVSHWAGRDNLNDTSIGIEIINLASEQAGVFTFPDFEPAQVEAIQQLASNILLRYPDISPKHVLGHADISNGRKSDPGPKFPWRQLAQAGIGAWYEESVKADFQQRFSTAMPAQAEVVAAFKKYGFAQPVGDDALRALTRAFQMHFRPTQYDGALDAETCAILYALNVRYP